MRTALVIVVPLGLDLGTSIRQRQEPVAVQALVAKPAIEALDEGVVGWFARPREIERDAAGVGPQIQVARDRLAALIDPDRRGIAYLAARPLKRFQYPGNPEAETAAPRPSRTAQYVSPVRMRSFGSVAS